MQVGKLIQKSLPEDTQTLPAPDSEFGTFHRVNDTSVPPAVCLSRDF
jgi:hypothetical protein